MNGIYFDEDKPFKTISEAYSRTKAKAKKLARETGDTVEKLDTDSIKATLGGFWKKLRGKNEEEDLPRQRNVDSQSMPTSHYLEEKPNLIGGAADKDPKEESKDSLNHD
jgi:hypothetical protein